MRGRTRFVCENDGRVWDDRISRAASWLAEPPMDTLELFPPNGVAFMAEQTDREEGTPCVVPLRSRILL